MRRAAAAPLIVASFVCCARATVAPSRPSQSRADRGSIAALPAADASDREAGVAIPSGVSSTSREGGDSAAPFDDPMLLHLDSKDALRALMGQAASLPLPLLGPWRLSQGNRAISRHSIGAQACRAGLRDVILQTP